MILNKKKLFNVRVVEFFFQMFVWCGSMCVERVHIFNYKEAHNVQGGRTDGSMDGFTNRETGMPILSGCNAGGGEGGDLE